MKKDELEANLALKALVLLGWFERTLEYQEKRPYSEIKRIAETILDRTYEYGMTEDEFFFIWDMFEDESLSFADDPEWIKSDLGIEIEPALTAPEYALAIGLVLAHKATRILKKDSTHKQHILSSLILINATEAKSYWMENREIIDGKNTANNFTEIENSIKDKELELWHKNKKSEHGRKAVYAKNSQPGGNYDKQRKIQEIWGSGKYSSKNQCALKECDQLGMSFKAARNALINVPKPINF